MAKLSQQILYLICIIILITILYLISFESLSPNLIYSEPSISISNTKNRLIRSDSSSSSYSTHICIGDSYHKLKTERMTSCRFKNICYDPNKTHFVYFSKYIDPKNAPKEIIYDNFNELLTDFWDKFILFRHNPPTFWQPFIEYRPMPNKSLHIKWFSDPTVYHYPYVTDNFGHNLGDNFYTIWHILDLFKTYSFADMQLLFADDALLKNKHSIQNILKIYPYIMQKMPLILYKDIIKELIPTNDSIISKIKYQMYCFDDFYIGTTSMRLQRSNTKPYEWNRFIFELFLNNEKHYAVYNKFMKTHRQKILFLNKTMGDHRRYYANDIDAVCLYVSELFNVHIDVLSDKDLMSMALEDQINKVLEYTVLITPCGSLAFLGVFMREGTAMITMDWYNQIFNVSSHLESYLWEFEARKKTFYYYVTNDDVVQKVSDEIIKTKRISFHDVALHWSDYIIRKKRLAVYVYSALRWVENYNGWKDTFKEPTKNWIDSKNAMDEM